MFAFLFQSSSLHQLILHGLSYYQSYCRCFFSHLRLMKCICVPSLPLMPEWNYLCALIAFDTCLITVCAVWCLVIQRLRVISLSESDVPSLLVLLPCWGCHGVIISLEPSVCLLSAVWALSMWVCVHVLGMEDATKSSGQNLWLWVLDLSWVKFCTTAACCNSMSMMTLVTSLINSTSSTHCFLTQWQ